MSGYEHPRSIAVVTDSDPAGFLNSLARAMDGKVEVGSQAPPMMMAALGGSPIIVKALSPADASAWGDVGGEPGGGPDAGIFLVSAVAPLSDALIDAWDACDDLGMPRAIVLTDIESPDAHTESTIAECQEALGDLVPVLAVDLPVLGDDDLPIGCIDLLTGDIVDYSQAQPAWSAGEPEHLALIADERSWLIEAILAETEQEEWVAAYLSGGGIEAGDLLAEFYSLVSRGRLHPILVCARRPAGLGMDAIARLIEQGFPAVGSARP